MIQSKNKKNWKRLKKTGFKRKVKFKSTYKGRILNTEWVLHLKRSSLRRVSKKLNKELVIYRKLRKIFLEENPICRVCEDEANKQYGDNYFCFNIERSEDVHHSKGRLGTLLNDVRYWVPVSRNCHIKIENNPKWAMEQGYTLLRLGK